MEDKIISTKGLCMLVMDEGAGLFDDIQKKQKNHESDLSMLNQLFDGKGDRMTLAQNKERIVPPNLTSISIGVQRNHSARLFLTSEKLYGWTMASGNASYSQW